MRLWMILGALPFALLWLAGAVGVEQLWGLSPAQAFRDYSFAVLCFMAGTLWGQRLEDTGHDQVVRALAILFFLLALCVLCLPLLPGIVLLALLYCFFIGVETYWLREHYPQLYWRLRQYITLVVVLSHALMALVIYGGLTL